MDDLLQTSQERMERLEKYVAKVEEAIKDLEQSIARGDMESLNEEEIQFYLSHSPDMICSAGIFLAKIQRALSYAEQDCKIVWARIWTETNKKKESLGLSNAKDREAYVQTNEEYIKAQRSVYEWKYNCTRAQLIYERYDSIFVACRKLAGMLPQYYAAQDLSTKYKE